MTGSALTAFTIFHVAVSLVAVGSGGFAALGFLIGRLSSFWNTLFLWTTAITCLTGFFFPFHGITPGIVIGAVGIVVLALAVLVRRKGWTKSYIAAACFAEALNIIVLIAQSFQKVSALHHYAPTGKGPIIAGLQLTSLLLIVGIAWAGIRHARTS